ncbi:hypothetical protein G7K_2353-t1 [Saitoella complicata NRRL Y-17804]|uniref:peptide-methionine (S)-S-oxide reductase n=2 Tax=Saitoella complicata (strain BCRC 22490 / CBS 7301 / JCM 7358 / NBRC 10748 / NRRL Y-17804) TaxID=698492 RepID=A0A0E9NED8_SAICN|nr:hypothetical protein G7K_2353-t1 [Saitoella complicata NRRL Y-17804]
MFMSSASAGVVANGSAAAALAPGLERATVANGCFWGTEHMYNKHFKNKLKHFRVGYTGGKSDSVAPSYRQVCSGSTGHAEALQITYDPKDVSYEELIEFFFRMHDPTQLNRQGPDIGTQYRSAIYYHSPEQKEKAERVLAKVQEEHYKGKKIATEVREAGVFYDAEDYHQQYLDNNPGGYECPSHYLHW